MTSFDDTRSRSARDSSSSAGVPDQSALPVSLAVGRCEQCGLGYEIAGVDVLDDSTEVTCRDCGGPVYAVEGFVEPLADADAEGLAEEDLNDCPECVAVGSVCRFHQGWMAGWDACCRFAAHVAYSDDDQAREAVA